MPTPTPNNTTYVFGAADAKIAKLLTDPSGGSATYASPIDVPGIKSIEISGTSDTRELRGDHRLIASISNLQTVEVRIAFAKWDAALYALFTGATLTNDAVTGDAKVSLSAGNSGSYFKLSAVSVAADGNGSNVSIILPKLLVTDLPPLALAEEDFATAEVTATALPLESTGGWLEWGYNSTAVSL